MEILPHDKTAEESLLSACIQCTDDAAKARDLLSPDDFYVTKHGRTFAAINSVLSNPGLNNSGPLDFPELAASMTRAGVDGPENFIAALLYEIPLAVNIEHTAGVIRQKAILRKIILIAHNGIKACLSCNGDSAEVVDSFQQKILSVEPAGSAGNDPVHVGELLNPTIDSYEAASRGKGLTGVTSGFPDIDVITCGFQASDMIVLAARPSMGKTALALNILHNAAKAGIPGLFFSLEMSRKQLVTRLISGDTGINSKRLESGKLSDDDWQHVNEAAERINHLPVYIDDTPNLHFAEVRRRIRIAFKKHGIRLAVIDYIGLMRGELSYHNRVDEVASVSRAIKATAKDLDIPILVLSQLNRNLESRSEKRPQLSDLRESGAIEQDADLVMLLYRDEVYNRKIDNPHRGKAEIEIAKHRNGACGVVLLQFNPPTTSFKSLFRGA